jgi:hypothetical protein
MENGARCEQKRTEDCEKREGKRRKRRLGRRKEGRRRNVRGIRGEKGAERNPIIMTWSSLELEKGFKLRTRGLDDCGAGAESDQ